MAGGTESLLLCLKAKSKNVVLDQLNRVHNVMLRRLPAIRLDDFQMIYIPIPKAGNTSVRAACADLLGAPPSARGPEMKKFTINVYEALNTTYWRFAVTRNPYERLLSCYSEKFCKEYKHKDFLSGMSKDFFRFKEFYPHMPFNEFVAAVSRIPDHKADRHFRSQTQFITNSRGDICVDALFDIHGLPSLAYELRRRTGRDVQIPHLLKSNHSSWEHYYTDSTKNMVQERFASDFRLLGYSF